MSSIQWMNPAGGSFTNRRDWAGGVVPGAYDSAILGSGGTLPYTVASSDDEIVSSVQIGAGATLSIKAGTFDIRFGTGPGVNAGAIDVRGGATLTASGTIVGGAYGDPSSGVIFAAAGSTVLFSHDAIVGGAFDSAGGGEVVFSGRYNSWDLPSVLTPIYNHGAMLIADNSAVDLYGGIVNSGLITMHGDGDGCLLLIGSYDTLLEGGGSLVMGGTGNNDDVIGANFDKATLTNVDNTISGSGQLGDLEMVLVNGAAGVIDANGPRTLFIDTGRNAVVNDGTIEASGAGGGYIGSRLENNGLLLANGGQLDLARQVRGSGSIEIDGGTLAVGSRFSQDVTFVGAGTLDLRRSRYFDGAVAGFSNRGASRLVLDDIHFGKRTEATFSGTSAGGVLTITDGVRTASMALTGDFLRSSFVVSDDGDRRVEVVAQTAPSLTSPTHAFVAAMAGLGVPPPVAAHPDDARSTRESVLTSPRTTVG